MTCLRATPVDHNLPSPAEMLNSRKYKTNLPAKSRGTQGDINAQLQTRQDEQKRHHDHGATILPEMIAEECIRAYNPRTHIWERARVLHHANTPRSYVIKTETGAIYRRNRRHLRKTGELFPSFQSEPVDESDDPPDDLPSTPHQVVDHNQPLSPLPVSVTSVARRSGRTINKPVTLDL